MSHSVSIKTQFVNKKGLFSAFDELGWKLKENSKIRTYSSDQVRNRVFDMIAVNPKQSGYDVGIVFNGDEAELVCDFYSPGQIAATLGADFCELKKKYIIEVTKQYYDDVEIIEMLADGTLIIEAEDGLWN